MGNQLLCIGSVLWDVIGRATCPMRQGSDVGGEITRLPGGVALNIAMTCARFGVRPVLLTAVGRDRPGDELLASCAEMGLDVGHVYRSDLPTDRYMAIEGSNGVVAAIADARSLEAAGTRILTPLMDGPFGTPAAPFEGLVAIDGNMTLEVLEEMATGDMLCRADLRIAPASPGKAERLLPFVRAGRGVLYVNCEEAGILCGCPFESAAEAAEALISKGAKRAIVTHGGLDAADAVAGSVITDTPPEITVARLTGAGDTFMAAHIASEAGGADRERALSDALKAAAEFVSRTDAP